jgi:hypothetical protein
MVRPRRRVLTPRLLAAPCVAIAAAGGFTAWHAHFRPPPCRAVHQLIEFDTAAQASLKDKTYFPPADSYGDARSAAGTDVLGKNPEIRDAEVAGHAEQQLAQARQVQIQHGQLAK